MPVPSSAANLTRRALTAWIDALLVHRDERRGQRTMRLIGFVVTVILLLVLLRLIS